MKRLGVIINIIVISLLLILMGGGVTLVHCQRTGTLSVAQLSLDANNIVASVCSEAQSAESMSDDASSDSDNCCAAEGEEHGCCANCEAERASVKLSKTIESKSCMQYMLLKGQPTTFHTAQNIDFQPMVTAVPDFLLASVPDFPVNRNVGDFLYDSPRHAPPRAYLRLLTTLLI